MQRFENGSIEFNGSRYWFKWTCGYQGTTDFEIREPNGRTFRAYLRHTLSDYERSVLNPAAGPNYAAEVESEIGLLRQSVCDNSGEIAPDTIAAFNAWRRREYESMFSHMESEPGRYGKIAELRREFPAPAPVRAGRWTKGTGWEPVGEVAEKVAA